MVQNREELAIAQERLRELQARMEQIVADPNKSRRVKEMELAGVRSMIAQIEQEIRLLTLEEIRETIHALQGELASNDTVNLLAVLSKTLDVLEEVTRILLQPSGGIVESPEPSVG